MMQFDSDDLAEMEANGSLVNVIIHEMGHVLGIGTLWEAKGLLCGAGTENPVLVGPKAQRVYADLLGESASRPVPVANRGESGTRDGHWREDTFQNELMTGFLNQGVNPLSLLTIAALEDMGYQVDRSAADAFDLPSAPLTEAAALGRYCHTIAPPWTPIPVEMPAPASAVEGAFGTRRVETIGQDRFSRESLQANTFSWEAALSLALASDLAYSPPGAVVNTALNVWGYKNNDLDRGHMVRRLDPVWGTPAIAEIANKDTFYYTNACPQHKDLNQKEWVELEDYVLGNTNNRDLKVSVITGPVFSAGDRPYRGILIPAEFWKVVAMKRADTGELSVTGYILTQTDLITGFEFVFGQFKTYQVKLGEIEARTGLDFGDLKNYDPKTRTEGGFESATKPTLIRGVGSLILG